MREREARRWVGGFKGGRVCDHHGDRPVDFRANVRLRNNIAILNCHDRNPPRVHTHRAYLDRDEERVKAISGRR